MTFPTIPTTGAGQILTTNNAAAIQARSFPAMSGLTKSAGDLIIAVAIAYQTSTGTNAAFSAWDNGFTEFHDSATSTTMAIGMAYKWSDGTETASLGVTQANTVTGHAVCTYLVIPGAHPSTPPEAGGRNSGTGTAANATSFDPSGWGAEDTLWIAVGGSGEDATTGSWTAISTAPTNYGSLYTTAQTGDAVGTVQGGYAFRQLNTSAEDVAAFNFDVSNARSAAVTIAVRPAPDFIRQTQIVAPSQAVHRASRW